MIKNLYLQTFNLPCFVRCLHTVTLLINFSLYSLEAQKIHVKIKKASFIDNICNLKNTKGIN